MDLDDTTTLYTSHDEPPMPERDAGANLRESVRAKIDATSLSHGELAKAVNYSKSMITRWLNGKHGRPTRDLDAALEHWLQQQTEIERSGGEFIETPTAERIGDTLAHAQAEGDMVCVYGAPGTGKTRAITHYRDTSANVWLATITPASAALVPALEEVAEAVGIHDVSGGARRLSRAIRSKVSHLDGLIILDEAQHLTLGAVEELRGIHDACGVGIALVGNELVYARLTGGSRAVHFAQLFSRIGARIYVRNPTKADVRALTDHWKLEDERALELLERVARKPGALRAITKILRLASAGRGPITAARVRAAMDHLGTEDA